MTVVNQLIRLLSTLKYPIFRQGSLSDDEAYPSTFITFWNNSTYEDVHYDDTPARTVWSFYLYVYSDDVEKMYSVLEQSVELLKSHGWVRDGKGIDVESDEPTHTGRMVKVRYIENYK